MAALLSTSLALIIPRHEASRPACSDELPCRGRPGLNIRSLWPGRTNLAACQNGHPVVRQHRPTLSFDPAFYGVRFRVAYSHRTRRRATAWAYGEPLAGYLDSPDRPTANCKQRWFPVSQHIDHDRFPHPFPVEFIFHGRRSATRTFVRLCLFEESKLNSLR
jgi:hypothetical protein